MSGPNYTPDIPQPNDIPAMSQDQILQNFQSIDSGTGNGFARNHVSLKDSNVTKRGKHNFCEFLTSPTSTPTSISGEATLFAATANGASQLLLGTDGVSFNYQLTRVAAGATGLFGTNGVTQAGPPQQNGGWTFLPGPANGGLILQYGTVATNTNGVVQVNFPIMFTTVFSITFSRRRPSNNPGSTDSWIIDSSINTSGFQIENQGSHSFSYNWFAIGN